MPLKRRSTRRLLVDPKRLKETRSPGGAPESPESEDLGGLPCSLPPSEVGLVPQPQEDEEDRVLLKSEEAVVSLEEVPCLSDDESDFDVSSSGSLSEDPRFRSPEPPCRCSGAVELRVSGESFLQDGPCFQSAPEIPFCHMCKAIPIPQRKHHLLKGALQKRKPRTSTAASTHSGSYGYPGPRPLPSMDSWTPSKIQSHRISRSGRRSRPSLRPL
ncbi:Uncharacterized protein FKW44_014234 [Caligus rogercresseyi]|uniref:Uncharacterized protein n=1 Tax=Caligus rogercresseyi TaxID=217165 RepID=A0A7T8GYL0_CALRO|nr:Uncharacterized protein FKW44_014234 [Caligus rogercresseyi]